MESATINRLFLLLAITIKQITNVSAGCNYAYSCNSCPQQTTFCLPPPRPPPIQIQVQYQIVRQVQCCQRVQIGGPCGPTVQCISTATCVTNVCQSITVQPQAPLYPSPIFPVPVSFPTAHVRPIYYPPGPQVIVGVAPGQPCALTRQFCAGGSTCIYTNNLGVCTCPNGQTACRGQCIGGSACPSIGNVGCTGNLCVTGAGDYCGNTPNTCVTNSRCILGPDAVHLCRCLPGYTRSGKACLALIGG